MPARHAANTDQCGATRHRRKPRLRSARHTGRVVGVVDQPRSSGHQERTDLPQRWMRDRVLGRRRAGRSDQRHRHHQKGCSFIFVAVCTFAMYESKRRVARWHGWQQRPDPWRWPRRSRRTYRIPSGCEYGHRRAHKSREALGQSEGTPSTATQASFCTAITRTGAGAIRSSTRCTGIRSGPTSGRRKSTCRRRSKGRSPRARAR